MTFQRSLDCRSISGVWKTQLPAGTIVQHAAGRKTENPHFDEDIEQTQQGTIDQLGEFKFSPVMATKKYAFGNVFINLRVWAKTKDQLQLLKKAESNGGFVVADSPEGQYSWAEGEIVYSECK